MANQPIRVLHSIDDLGGGGSERWLWDIVRLSDPSVVLHRVVTVRPEAGDAVYSEPLRRLGALGRPQTARAMAQAPAAASGGRHSPGRALLRGLKALGPTSARVAEELRRFRPQVVHCHLSYGLLLGLLLKSITRLPLVHTVPALMDQMRDAGFFWMPGLYSRCHSRVDRFFTAYPSELTVRGVLPAKILELEGGVDLEASDAARLHRREYSGQIRTRLGIPPEAVLLLSVGRLHPSKGHAFALDALATIARNVPQVHWVVLGEGPERSALEARARALGIADRAHFMGFIPEPLPWYAAANLYLRTAILEGDNLSSYQAMALELPVVGFDTGRATDLLGRVGHGTRVPNRDTAALAGAASQILGLPDRGMSIGARGREYAQRHLALRRTVALHETVYAELTRKKTVPAQGGEPPRTSP